MKPSVGRIVFFHSPFLSDSISEFPAIITRVWSDICVNLTIFPNNGNMILRISVIQDEEMNQEIGWRWPPKI